MTTILTNNEAESIVFAHNFAKTLKKGNIVTFTGDLGAGKTFLCREIIKYICGTQVTVVSPTFNLLQLYEAADFTIFHFDLYRLKSPNEIYELGVEEAWNDNLCLIEWPEIITHILPQSSISIDIKIIADTKRLITISNHS